MSFFHALTSQPQGDPYTTADGKQIILVISDSLGATSDSGPGPTVGAGIAEEWNGSALVPVTNADVAQANNGSPWPQFALTLNAGNGIKPVFVTNVVPGAEFSPNGDNTNWSSTGTARAAAETKINGAVANLGVIPKVAFAFIGSNDIRANTAIATVLSDIDDFIIWFTTEWPDTDLVFCQLGQTDQVAGSANTQGSARAMQIMARLKYHYLNTTRVYFFANGGCRPTYDNLHWNQTNNNVLGRMAANWMLNPTLSKFVRCIVASHFTEPTAGQIAKIQTWVTDTNYATGIICYFKWRGTVSEEDYFNDWGFQTFVKKQNTVTADANGWTTTAGGGYIRSRFFANMALLSDVDDFRCGAEVITQTGNGALFGVRNPSTTAEMSIQVVTTTKTYRANDTTATSVAGDFTDGESVYVARNGGNKYLYSDTTQDNTAAVASTAVITLEQFIFGRNNNGSIDLQGALTLGGWCYVKETVSGSVIDAADKALKSGW